MDVGDLRVRLTLDGDGFEVTAQRAGQVLRRLSGEFDATARYSRTAETSLHSMATGLRHTIVAMGALRFALMDIDDFLLGFPKHVAKTAGEFERLQKLMEGLSKSGDDAQRRLEGMRDAAAVVGIAKNSPFEVKSLSDAFVKLKTTGIDPSVGQMRALVDSVAKFGGSSDQLNRASVAIAQMSGKGVVSMEELRQQLGEAIPNAMELMARGMGLSMDQLVDKVSKGTVNARAAVSRMFVQMEMDAKGSAERMMTTFPGALERLKTEYGLFEKRVADQGFLSSITFVMKDLASFLDSETGQGLAKSIGQAMQEITTSLIVAGKWIANNTEQLKAMAEAVVSLWGGGKLAGAFNAWRANQQRAQERAEAFAKKANREKDLELAQLQNLERRQLAGLQRLEEARDKAVQKAIDRNAKERASVEEGIQKQEARLKQLADRREQLVQRAIERERAAHDRAVEKRDAAAAKEEAKAAAKQARAKDLDTRGYNILQGAEDADKQRVQRFEDRKKAALERLAVKEADALEKLRLLEERKAEAVANKQQDNAQRIERLQERRARAEADLARRTQNAQQAILDLEKKRAALIEQARAGALKGIDRDNASAQKELDGVRQQMAKAREAALSPEQHKQRLSEIRQEETAKRLARESEISGLQKLTQQREVAQAAYRDNLKHTLRAEELAARVNAGEKPRYPAGSTEGRPGTYMNRTAILEDAAKSRAETDALGQRLQAMQLEETHRAANIRLLEEEQKAAQKAGDALAKVRPDAGAVTALEQRAAQLQAQIAAQEAKKATIQREGLAGGDLPAKIQERVNAYTQEIAKKGELIAQHQSTREALDAELQKKVEAINATEASTRSIDAEIQGKQRQIEGYAKEADAIRKSAAERGGLTAAQKAQIDNIDRLRGELEREAQAHRDKADVLRNTAVEHNNAAAAIRNQVDALDRNVQALGDERSANQQKLNDLRHINPELDRNVQAIDKKTEALRKEHEQTRRNIDANEALGRVAAKTGSAIVNFGRSLVGNIAFAVAFNLAMEGLVWVMDKLTASTRKAEEAQLRLRRAQAGQAIEGDPDKLREDKGDLETRQWELNKQIDAQERALNGMRVKGQDPDANSPMGKKFAEGQAKLAQLQGDLSEVQKKLTAMPEAIQQAERDVATKMATEQASSRLKSLETAVEKNVSVEKFQEEMRQLDTEWEKASRNKDTASKAELERIKARRKEMQFELVKSRLDNAKTLGDAEIERMKAAGVSDSDIAATRGSFDKYRKGLADELANMQSDEYRPPKEKKNKHLATDSPYDDYIKARQKNIVKLEETAQALADGVVTIEEINARARAEVDSLIATTGMKRRDKPGAELRFPTLDERDAAIKLRAQELKDQAAQGALQKAAPMYAKLREDLENSEAALTGSMPKRGRQETAVDALLANLSVNRPAIEAELKKLGTSWEEFAGTLRAGAAQVGVREQIATFRDQAKQLGIGNIRDEKKRIQAQADFEIEQVKRVRDQRATAIGETGELTTQQLDEVARLYEEANNVITGIQERARIQAQGPIATLAEQWGKGMDNMKTAAAGWMDSFVNGLAEGKLKMGDFLRSVLADIAKVKMKEVMSEGITPMMTGAVSSIGNAVKLNGTEGAKTPIDLGAAGKTLTEMIGKSYDAAVGFKQSAFADKLSTAGGQLVSGLKAGGDTLLDYLLKGTSFLIEGLGSVLKAMAPMGEAALSGASSAMSWIGSAVGSFFGGGAAFANGGVMTSLGSVALRKYANGGIANRPQLALYGEGSRPEAFVPLPDGRRIPVNLMGQGAPGQKDAAAPSVIVNVINESGTPVNAQQRGAPRFDGRQMILDVVLAGMSQPGGFRDNMRNLMDAK